MKNPDDSELWRDALEDRLDPAFAATSLARAIEYAHRLRRRRRITTSLVVAGTLGLLLGAVVRWSAYPDPALEVSQSSSTAAHNVQPALAGVHFLTDEELLSRFPDRALALIGPPDHQQLVFLDDPH